MFQSLQSRIVVVFIAGLLAVAGPVFAGVAATDCTTAATLEPNASLRGYAGGEGEVELFRLDLPSPGIATVDVVTPRVEANPVKLDLSSGCDGASAGKVAILEQSAAHLVLAARTPATRWLRVTTRGPGRYKVVTGFRETEVRDETAVPQALSGGGYLQVRRTSFYTTGAVPKNEPEVVDPDPATRPLSAGPGAGIDELVFYTGVCGPAGQDDDHGDTPGCATPLRPGQRVAGEIGNLWDDDLDVFALTLSEVATVEVAVGGDAGVFAALYSRSGQRLATDGEGWESPHVLSTGTLTATLGPGRYYLRVEGGDLAAAAYELTVTARP